MNELMNADAAEDESPRSSMSSSVYVLVFGSFMLAGLMFLAWLGRPNPTVAVGEPLPRLDLQPLLNTQRQISKEDLDGKLAVLHFWGTWCPPCILEFPEFAKLAAEFEGSDEVVIVSVSCSGGPEYDLERLRAETARFLENYQGDIPTYSDAAAMTRESLAYILPNGSFGYPTTLLVGRDGKIIKAIEGYRPDEMQQLVKTIKSML